ncbi:uncharacterized protein LOC62_02G002561 [Vanrija pseudolonga]|uniref:Uncharacterized protein n=1 Tax=Vanrija pseudolonga TaxID=143232 RepID=A0AAF0Y695_9TREE|nr:hypothetical protein LOC62_02G002561 [Vanrija pseudolonga]
MLVSEQEVELDLAPRAPHERVLPSAGFVMLPPTFCSDAPTPITQTLPFESSDLTMAVVMLLSKPVHSSAILSGVRASSWIFSAVALGSAPRSIRNGRTVGTSFFANSSRPSTRSPATTYQIKTGSPIFTFTASRPASATLNGSTMLPSSKLTLSGSL